MKTIVLFFLLCAGPAVAQNAVLTVEQAEAKARAMWPDIDREGSEMRKEMVAISQWLESRKDPVLNRSDCGLRVARMAAAKLGIAARKTAAVPVVPAAPALNTAAEDAVARIEAEAAEAAAARKAAADETLRRRLEEQRREHMEYLRQQELKREIRKVR